MTFASDDLSAALSLRAWHARREADPLSYWRIGVPRLREAFALFAPSDGIDELALRACNKGTKTESAAAYVLACLQKRERLDGMALPQWRGPVEAAQFVLDYKQQILSVQPAYLRLLGGWPHHARYNGEVLSSIHVQPMGGDDDETKWSVLHFLSQENRRSGLGVRADLAAFDEPPAIEILREIRKAPHAGRRGIRLVAFTPTIRRRWADLKSEYGDTPRRTLRRINQDWAEVRWSLDDVADWILSPAEKAKLRRQYEHDPLAAAREHGDYIDTSGSCPFHVPTLLEMLGECREPDIVQTRIAEEQRDLEGKPNTMRVIPVEIYEEPQAGERYWMTIDPSSGVDDEKHDPFEIEIGKVGSGDLCARAGGHLSGQLVGKLGAGLCRRYNNAVADPEVNDRWGVNVVEGFHAADYGNFAREQRELQYGAWSNEIGFHNTQKTRPLIVGAIQAWIEAWRAGVKYGRCPSRFILNTLLDCIMDETDKIVAAPGLHDEALICWGQLLRKAVTRSSREVPDLYKPPKNEMQRLVSLVRGLDDDDEPERETRQRNGRGPRW